ncbi:MAG: sigma-70 family RNA polymerase sigma factor [Intestinibacillus sp.]
MALSDAALEREALLRYEASAAGDNSAWRAAFRTAFFRAMQDELTARQHEALCLHYLEGLSQRQIAVRWGVSPSAVCRHLQRAKTRLRRLLAYNLACQPLPFDG